MLALVMDRAIAAVSQYAYTSRAWSSPLEASHRGNLSKCVILGRTFAIGGRSRRHRAPQVSPCCSHAFQVVPIDSLDRNYTSLNDANLVRHPFGALSVSMVSRAMPRISSTSIPIEGLPESGRSLGRLARPRMSSSCLPGPVWPLLQSGSRCSQALRLPAEAESRQPLPWPRTAQQETVPVLRVRLLVPGTPTTPSILQQPTSTIHHHANTKH